MKGITKVLIRLSRCSGWSTPLLFAYDKVRFSRIEVHIAQLRLVSHQQYDF